MTFREGTVDAVIVAAGTGERFGGDVPKQLLDLAGTPLLAWAVQAFQNHPAVGRVVVVLPSAVLRETPRPAWLAQTRLIEGGRTRGESAVLGVRGVRPGAEVVLVHDGVRPFVSGELIERVHRAAREGPTVPVLPVNDTVKELDEAGRVIGTFERARLRRVQTPQGFPADTLRELHEKVNGALVQAATDDASLCESVGLPVQAVDGDPLNLKVTTPVDLEYARWLVERGLVRRPK